MYDSSLATDGDADVATGLHDKYRIEYYFTTLHIVIREIEDQFDSQAVNTVCYTSAMSIWKDR